MSTKKKVSKNSQKNNEILSKTEIRQSTIIQYQGNLPHPEILKGFEDILSGSANRIIIMAEEQQKHILKLEELEQNSIITNRNKNLESRIKYNYRGQIFGFLIIILLIITGTILLLKDKNIQGSASIIIALITYGYGYIHNKK